MHPRAMVGPPGTMSNPRAGMPALRRSVPGQTFARLAFSSGLPAVPPGQPQSVRRAPVGTRDCDYDCAANCYATCMKTFPPDIGDPKTVYGCTAACIKAETDPDEGRPGLPQRLRASAGVGRAAARRTRGTRGCDGGCIDNCHVSCVKAYCPDPNDKSSCDLANAFLCANACIKAADSDDLPGPPGGFPRVKIRMNGGALSVGACFPKFDPLEMYGVGRPPANYMPAPNPPPMFPGIDPTTGLPRRRGRPLPMF